MENIYYVILSSLSEGSHLETDGTSYWWVNGDKYTAITQKTFKSFIKKKLVYPKRLDDETTCYYLTTQSKEAIFSKFFSEESEVKVVNNHQINKIKNFINL